MPKAVTGLARLVKHTIELVNENKMMVSIIVYKLILVRNVKIAVV